MTAEQFNTLPHPDKVVDYEDLGGFAVRNLGHLNVVMGKNGCGKSTVLKQFDQGIGGRPGVGKVRYISPERAGFLVYEAGIDQTMAQNAQWMANNRRNNQSANFKQQSVTLFRQFELRTLRSIEREQFEPGYSPRTFEGEIIKINCLLERVRIERAESGGFKIVELDTGRDAAANEISSGESELIALAIDVLTFASEADTELTNFLLIDEPDVNLHPDVQDRLARF